MRILMKSIYLFILGIYIDNRRKSFDNLLMRYDEKYGSLSSPKLVHISNHCYKLYLLFYKCENELRRDILIKSLVKKNI